MGMSDPPNGQLGNPPAVRDAQLNTSVKKGTRTGRHKHNQEIVSDSFVMNNRRGGGSPSVRRRRRKIDNISDKASSTAKRDEKYEVKLTESEIFTNGFKSLTGIGILALPGAYKDVGLIAAWLVSAYVAVLVMMSNSLLIRVMKKAGKTHRSFGDVTEYFLGDTWRVLVEVAVISTQALTLILYIKYVGE